MNTTKTLSFSIEKIVVKDLFGKYNYVLPSDKDAVRNLSKVLIFYGNNGSGKTTILKLIYHLLSTDAFRGHKTKLAHIKFSKFSVKFTDGTTISAQRAKGQIIGKFSMKVYNELGSVGSIDFKIDDDGEVKDYDNKKWHKIQNYLEKFNYQIYFLSDSRHFDSDVFSDEYLYEQRINKRSRQVLTSSIRVRNALSHKRKISDTKLFEEYMEDAKSKALNLAISRSKEWIDKEVYQSTSRADMDINTIYLRILQNISMSSKETEEEMNESKNILEELINLEKRIQDYSIFKIISPLDISTLIKTIKVSSSESHTLIRQIILPYIESIEAKLDSLKTVYERLDVFINSVNQFLDDKRLIFEFYDGIKITSNGGYLKPEFLSSGEKQLLLLFCNTLTSLDQPSIFIIDEPEMSLNVKWQRNLISALLKLAEESQTQFIFASHSIELLTQYKKQVVKLSNE